MQIITSLNKINMKQLVAFSILLTFSLVFVNCGGGGDPYVEPSGDISLRIVDNRVEPFEILSISVEGFDLNEESYTGYINDVETVLLPANDSTLAFVLPDIPAGEHDLTITLNSSEVFLSLDVRESQVVDEAVVFAETKESYKTLITDLNEYENSSDKIAGSLTNQENIQELQKMFADFENEWLNLSETDKKAAAKFIEVNKDILFPDYPSLSDQFDSLNYRSSSLCSGTPEASWTCFASEYKKRLAILVATTIISSDLVISGWATFGWGVAVGSIGLYASYRQLISLNDLAISYFDKTILAGTIDDLHSRSKLEFISGEEKELDLKMKYTNLNVSHKNSTEPLISTVVNGTFQISEAWDKLKSYASYIFKGDVYRIDKKTERSKTMTVSVEYYSIDQASISNSNVTVSVKKNTDKNLLEVTFETTATTKQDFTFDVHYKANGIADLTKTISASVDPNPTYKLEMISGDKQTINLGEKSAPLKVRLTTESGKPYDHENIRWFVLGGKSLGNTKTNKDGYTELIFEENEAADYFINAAFDAADPTIFVEFLVTVEIPDSMDIYKAAVVGNWTVTHAEYPNNPARNLELYADGTGKYVGEGGQPFPNGKTYGITWQIRKKDNKYYLYESGFWHYGYDNLERENLTYPLTKFRTYNDFGNGPVEQLTYSKN